MFTSFGAVDEVTVLRNADGISRGCGFVKMASRAQALAAIARLNNSVTMDGCRTPMVVKLADTDREKAAKRAHVIHTLPFASQMRYPPPYGFLMSPPPGASMTGMPPLSPSFPGGPDLSGGFLPSFSPAGYGHQAYPQHAHGHAFHHTPAHAHAHVHAHTPQRRPGHQQRHTQREGGSKLGPFAVFFFFSSQGSRQGQEKKQRKQEREIWLIETKIRCGWRWT